MANYGVQLTTDKVKDKKGSVSPEMYDYLASECARNAIIYDDLYFFRDIFSDRSFLVQDKYEALARKEVSLASDYLSIMECKTRYPDLEHITEPKFNEIASQELGAAKYIADVKICEERYPHLQALIDLKKMAFYHIDAEDLGASYAYAQRLVDLGSFVFESQYSSTADSFVKNYQSYYDPDEKLPLAHTLSRFYSALDKVHRGYYTSYIRLPAPGIRKSNIEL